MGWASPFYWAINNKPTLFSRGSHIILEAQFVATCPHYGRITHPDKQRVRVGRNLLRIRDQIESTDMIDGMGVILT